MWSIINSTLNLNTPGTGHLPSTDRQRAQKEKPTEVRKPARLLLLVGCQCICPWSCSVEDNLLRYQGGHLPAVQQRSLKLTASPVVGTEVLPCLMARVGPVRPCPAHRMIRGSLASTAALYTTTLLAAMRSEIAPHESCKDIWTIGQARTCELQSGSTLKSWDWPTRSRINSSSGTVWVHFATTFMVGASSSLRPLLENVPGDPGMVHSLLRRSANDTSCLRCAPLCSLSC